MIETELREEIKAKGAVPQSRFMELALETYYRTHEGIGRDFTTAPEVSQMFGELIGLWALDLYHQLGSPEKLICIELGPGRGTLMADILRVSKLSSAFSQALEIHFVEMSPRLKKLQRQALPGINVMWHDTLETIPSTSFPVLILANEFFDALPTAYYMRREGTVYERYVGENDNMWEFVWKPLKQEKGPDTTWEEGLGAMTWMKAILKRLEQQKGAFLCFDYGYEEGEGETLQALFEGQPSLPLQNVGRSDLSCHVNFGQLKKLALDQNFSVLGPTPQTHFLNNLNVQQRLDRLKQQNPLRVAELEAGYTRLTHPSQMGLLFKVLTVFTPHSLSPLGFKTL